VIWDSARGIGYLPVTEQPYDADYFAKYEAYAATEMGRAITQARVELVRRHVSWETSLVDVGIGCGAFVDAVEDGGLAYGFGFALGYDINPVGVAWLEKRFAFRDPRSEPVDALTFWDSLEHITNAAEFIASAREWVFCSLPIVPGDGPPRADWKHYRPDEHCWYWTRMGLVRWMADHGFRCVECNLMESDLGREDIETFAFRRVG
jgi:hypothetical protein